MNRRGRHLGKSLSQGFRLLGVDDSTPQRVKIHPPTAEELYMADDIIAASIWHLADLARRRARRSQKES